MHPKTKLALEHLAVIQHITRLQNMNNQPPPLENYDRGTERVLNDIEMIAESQLRIQNMFKQGENMGLPARPVMSQSQSNNTNTPAGRSTVKERLQVQKIAELENENAQLKQAVSVFDDRKVEIYERVNVLRQNLEAQFLKVTEEIYDGFFPGA
jgi:hypothetical protein